MEQQTKPQEESNPPAKSSPPVQVPEPLSTTPEQPATEQKLENVEREMNAFECSTLRWTRATFAVLAVTCIVVGFQGYEMLTGSVDTRRLAEAAKAQADKTASIADAAEKMRLASERLAAANEASARGIDTSNRQNINASNLQQRPYLVVSELRWVDRDSSSESGFRYANVRFRNVGQTPGFATQMYAKLILVGPFTERTDLDGLLDPLFKQIRPIYKGIGQDIPPSPAYGTLYTTADLGHKPTQAEMTGVEKGDAAFIFVGGVFYRDIRGVTHETQFCEFFYGPNSFAGGETSWHFCGTRNTMK
jgi:hypothetical protein